MRNKTLIMNHPDDEKINSWTLEYIFKKVKEDSKLSIYLENVGYSEFQEKFVYKQSDWMDQLDHRMDENDLSKPFTKIPKELFKAKIYAKGLLNTNLDQDDDNYDIDHNKFMLDILKNAKGPFIAIIDIYHIYKWLRGNEISVEEYDILLPNHNKIFELFEDEELESVEDFYNELLDIEGIEIVEIGNSMDEN